MKTEVYRATVRQVQSAIGDLLSHISRLGEQGVIAEQDLTIDPVCELRVIEDGSVHPVRRTGDLGKQLAPATYSSKDRLLKIKGALLGVIQKAHFIRSALTAAEEDHTLVLELETHQIPSVELLSYLYDAWGGKIKIQPNKPS